MQRVSALIGVLALLASACGDSAGDGITTATSAAEGTPVSAADGGTVTSDDGRLTLDIPPGAVTEDVEVSISALPPGEVPEGAEDLPVVGVVYELEPDGLQLGSPATVEVRLDPDDLGVPTGEAGVPLVFAAVFGADGSATLLDDQVISRTESHVVLSGTLSHFSRIVTLGDSDGGGFRFASTTRVLTQWTRGGIR